jgi:hypothetical protein
MRSFHLRDTPKNNEKGMTGNHKLSSLNAAAILILCNVMALLAGPKNFRTNALTLEEIVDRMQRANRERELRLQDYEVLRTYAVHNGLTGMWAELEVRMRYKGGQKEFEVINERGSRFLRSRVLKKLIKAEQEASGEERKQGTEITEENYQFSLERIAELPYGRYYLLRIKPRRKDKYLLDGLIWVIDGDFAIVQIVGRPARRPSFWTWRIHFIHQYTKVNDFWLPASNQTEARVFLFGKSTVSIRYREYRVNQQQPVDEDCCQE